MKYLRVAMIIAPLVLGLLFWRMFVIVEAPPTLANFPVVSTSMEPNRGIWASNWDYVVGDRTLMTFATMTDMEFMFNWYGINTVGIIVDINGKECAVHIAWSNGKETCITEP